MAFAYPVDDETAVKERLEALRKKYFDATHHCYAYILGIGKVRHRAADDGEPNHSAGDPILGQIRARNLTNTLVVVVRYFGGTKLGVGGLVQAYKSSAEEALANAVIVEREVTVPISFTFDYEATPEVMKLIKDYDIKIVEQHYGDASILKTEVPLREKGRLLDRLALLQQLKTKITYELDT